jgi:hypothetical protein
MILVICTWLPFDACDVIYLPNACPKLTKPAKVSRVKIVWWFLNISDMISRKKLNGKFNLIYGCLLSWYEDNDMVNVTMLWICIYINTSCFLCRTVLKKPKGQKPVLYLKHIVINCYLKTSIYFLEKIWKYRSYLSQTYSFLNFLYHECNTCKSTRVRRSKINKCEINRFFVACLRQTTPQEIRSHMVRESRFYLIV